MNYILNIEYIEEIEDIIEYNLSYGISAFETLTDLGHFDLIDYFDY